MSPLCLCLVRGGQAADPQRWQGIGFAAAVLGHIHRTTATHHTQPVKPLVGVARDLRALKLVNLALGGLAGQAHSTERICQVCLCRTWEFPPRDVLDCGLVECVTLMVQAHLSKPASRDGHGSSLELLRQVVRS